MNCRFSFKHVKRSQTLIDYSEPKILAKIEKYATKPIDVHVTVTQQGINYDVRCHVKGGDGFSFQLEAENTDLHTAIDMMLHKMEGQLKKQKDKIKHHKTPERSNFKHLRVVEEEEEDWDAVPIDAEELLKLERAKVRSGS
ncbi:MAG: ribosome-associated translation inhibitor RaiA [Deltaproteobacteria bacterium]|nr:ribosome-associated translation inhibitor RaiA [Deltaproteobacteria bacterium]